MFPLADAEKYIRGIANDLERHGSRLRWHSHDGMTELDLTDIQEKTFDGLVVSELVTLTHTSARLAMIPPELAAYLNKWATISSLVAGEDDRPTRLVAKVGIFSTDQEAAERVYAPMLCTEAAYVGWHAARIVRGEFERKPAETPLSMSNQSPFDMADFEAAKAWMYRQGYLGTLGDYHFTVEFPWASGAKSRLFMHDKVRDELQDSC